MKKILIIVIFFIVAGVAIPELIPHEHLSIMYHDVERIDICTENKRVEITDAKAIGKLVKGINRVRLYQSDLESLQSSPEKFIEIYRKDGSQISIRNVGIYSDITDKQKVFEEKPKIINADLYITSFFMVDYVYLIARLL